MVGGLELKCERERRMVFGYEYHHLSEYGFSRLNVSINASAEFCASSSSREKKVSFVIKTQLMYFDILFRSTNATSAPLSANA